MSPFKKPRTILQILRGRQSGFAPVIIILIVAIVVAAGGMGFYFYKTSWETYQNKEYGFEMKYPKDMKYKKFGSAVEFAYPDQRFTENTGIYAEMPLVGNASIVIRTEKNISYQNYTAAVKLKRIITEETETNINGVLFKQVDAVWRLVNGGGARPEGTREIHTFVMKNNVIYDIVYYQLPNEADYINDYYKILSTFKFIETLEEAAFRETREMTDSDREDVYYMKRARETNDINLCEKVTDSGRRDVCYSNIASDAEDINLCEKINKSDIKDTCYSNVIPKTKDASLCEKIAYPAKQDSCYFRIALETKDGSLCEKVVEKDACYYTIAPKTKDASLCEKIIKSGTRDRCYDKTAEEAKDINLCEKISVSAKKNECYIHVAMGVGDISFCEKITDIVKKDVCYFGVVGVTRDSSMCEKMSTRLGKDECYFNVGMTTRDISLCEKITDSSMNLKDQCYTHAR